MYWKGDTLEDLARQIGVDAAGLVASVARMNDFARTGNDLEFDRGGNVFDRYYGDVKVKPNPNLAPIGKGAVLCHETVSRRHRHQGRPADRPRRACA